MKILFKKPVSSSYTETAQLCESIDKMLDHVPVYVNGKPYWNHGCRASTNKSYSGDWEVVVMTDRNLVQDRANKVHIHLEKAEENFHLPYMKLQVQIESSLKNSNVLKVL